MEIDTKHHPELIDDSAFVAPTAVVLGRVSIGARSSIWYGAVLRGDIDTITIGEETSIQDNAVVHVDAGVPARIGNRVTVGHGAIIHGAVVEDDALIGIGAIVLNNARVGRGAVVGAGAVVPEGMEIPPGMLALGVPARVIREVSPELAARTKENAEHYVLYGKLYREAEDR